MADYVRGTIVEIGSPRVVGRGLRRVMKRVNIETVREWWSRFMPLHFTVGGGRRYGYESRTFTYNERKRKKYGHTRPLVFSGRTERSVKRFIGFRGSNALRGVGRMQANALNFGGRAGGRNLRGIPPMRDELTRVTNDEVSHLALFHKKLRNRAIKGVQRSATRQTRRT